MFVVIPILCFVFTFLTFYKKANGEGWRSAFLSASIIWGLLVTIITEFLSIPKLLTFGWVLGLWAGTSAAWAVVAFRLIQGNVKPRPLPTLPPSVAMLVLGVTIIVTTTGFIAVIAPPNTSDSMTYHMSRVVHWIQNRSVAFYPTHIPRQLYQNPWAEFAILHLQLLSSGDRFANLIQWFSMFGSIVGITLIAQQLGAGTYGQILAAVVTATLPMGILQASSTQNDYVVSYWLVCFVYYIMALTVTGATGWSAVLGAGVSLGLAILTKATAYLFAIPFLLWLVLSRLRTVRWESWKAPLVIIVVALSLNVGHYERNKDLYGSALGPGSEWVSGEQKYANGVFTIPSLISNMLRNLGLHLGTPFRRINAATERGIRLLHRPLGLNVSDPRTSWIGLEFHIPIMSNHEDRAGNPIHLALILLSITLVFILRGSERLGTLLKYLVAVTTGFLLFSLYLKWTPWHSRLHLPLFVLWSPVIAIVSCKITNHRVATSIATVLLISALPWVFYNKSRPLLGKSNIVHTGRIDQYFSNLPTLREPYIGAAEFLNSKKCLRVGLSFGEDDPEYLLWVALQETANTMPRLEHVNVQNVSRVKSHIDPLTDFSPCAIISTQPFPRKEMAFKGRVYVLEWSRTPVSVFMGR